MITPELAPAVHGFELWALVAAFVAVGIPTAVAIVLYVRLMIHGEES